MRVFALGKRADPLEAGGGVQIPWRLGAQICPAGTAGEAGYRALPELPAGPAEPVEPAELAEPGVPIKPMTAAPASSLDEVMKRLGEVAHLV